MAIPASAMWFRVNFANGTLVPIEDQVTAQNSPGFGMIGVTNVPGGTTPEQVIALLYTSGSLPFNWAPPNGAKWTVSYTALNASGVQFQFGSIAFTTNPAASTTISLGGSSWSFVASGATGNQTNIGASLAATLTTLVGQLANSADANLSKFAYYANGTTLFIVSQAPLGGSQALATTVSGATPSGAALTPSTPPVSGFNFP